MKVTRTLVIPDAHDDPYHDQDRFDLLSNFIEEQQPENIVQIGDFMSLDSITSWNDSKPLYKEGKRLKDDLDSGKRAYNKVMQGIRHQRDIARNWKKKQYSPNLFWFEANHEDRTKRYIIQHPELEGFIPVGDLVGAKDDGWKIIPYRDYQYIRGVGFTHVPHFYSGNPIGGKYITRRALELNSNSIVFGHRHILALDEWARAGEKQKKISALCVGCFLDYQPHYTVGGTSFDQWWSGLIVLHHYDYGQFDVETYSMDRLIRNYS